MFNEADQNSDKNLSLAELARIAGKYGMEDLKSFKIREFVQDLNRRKKVIDQVEKSFVSLFKRSDQSSSIEGGVRVDREVEETVLIKKKVVKKVMKNIFSKF